MEIDSAIAFLCWGILWEAQPNAVPPSLSCSAGSAVEVATSAGCKMASKSQARQSRPAVAVDVCVCVWRMHREGYILLLILRSLTI